MENNNKKIFKIIITLSVIIIFILIVSMTAIFLTKAPNKKHESNNSIQNPNEYKQMEINEIIESQTVVNNTIIEDNTVQIDKRYGKIEIVWIDKQNNIIQNPLSPEINTMTPVKYSETAGEFQKTTFKDDNWYNYRDKKWANAVDENGSYFVWIPRYAYKIIYYTDNTYNKEIGYSDSRGILKINNNKTLTKISSNNLGLIETGNHYIVEPAFMKDTASGYKNGGWDINLSGLWVAKYEMSMEKDGVHTDTENQEIGNILSSDSIKAVSKPAVSSWRNITIGNSYINSFNYNRTLESHLIKNSEWGAVTYLAYSKYGLNEKAIQINKSTKYITGGNKLESDIYNYNGYQSTTGNATGIYDLAGGAYEFVAGFTNNGYEGISQYGGSSKEEDLCANYKNTKYKTVYSHIAEDTGGNDYKSTYANGNYELNSTKRGEAIYETSLSGFGSDSWNTNSSFFIQQDTPFFTRGGDFGSSTSAGLFSFNSNSGKANAGETYRVVLAI